MSGHWSARPQSSLFQPWNWEIPSRATSRHCQASWGLRTGSGGEKGNKTAVAGNTTCNTALMSRRSSAGFQRPRSLVTWSGCLLFFTRLVSPGAGAGLGGTGVLGVLDTWTEGRSRVNSELALGQLGLQTQSFVQPHPTSHRQGARLSNTSSSPFPPPSKYFYIALDHMGSSFC